MEHILFIGDVHGRYRQYKNILKSTTCPSIQVGDMGVGFFSSAGLARSNPPHEKMKAGHHRFIRGNHDNPSVCRKHSQWISDGQTEITAAGTKIMYIGGAWSIDRAWRIEGESWWADEEVSYNDLSKILITYDSFRPDILVTHDCPQSIAIEMFLNRSGRPLYKTRTGQFFDHLLQLHAPQRWIFGHWHESRDEVFFGTQFICLAELETKLLSV